MRYDGEKQEHGKGNNVIIVVLCIAILILTFMLFIINISRLRNLFSSDSRKTQTESTQNSNVVLSGSVGGEDPEAGGGAGSGSTTDTAVGEDPAVVPAEVPVEEAAAEPAEEEKEEAEQEDSDADRIRKIRMRTASSPFPTLCSRMPCAERWALPIKMCGCAIPTESRAFCWKMTLQAIRGSLTT